MQFLHILAPFVAHSVVSDQSAVAVNSGGIHDIAYLYHNQSGQLQYYKLLPSQIGTVASLIIRLGMKNPNLKPGFCIFKT